MRQVRVFDQLSGFAFVHHRALNSAETLRSAAEAAGRRPDLEHAVEGDVCWNVTGDRRDLYFRHPRLLTDVLAERDIDAARERGELLTVEQVVAHPEPDVRYIVELKTGVGDPAVAYRHLAGLLQEGLRDRFWIDAFSLAQLRGIKAADPAVATSLHTKLVAGGWIVRSSLEPWPLSLHRLAALDAVDAVTLTYKSSTAHWFAPLGATIDGVCAGVLRAGKRLALGGLGTPEMFERARRSAAMAGYAKFPLDEVPVQGGEG